VREASGDVRKAFPGQGQQPAEQAEIERLKGEIVRARLRDRPKAKPRRIPTSRKRVLLSGGNPQIAKADGNRPVQDYISAIPDWKRDTGRRLDRLISSCVPTVQKAVRWNSPMYGLKGRGWFASFHVFTKYVKLTFFKGTELKPLPPGGTGKEARWIDIHEQDMDEQLLVRWIRQAAALPGWGKN
jgi:hypothetical protein